MEITTREFRLPFPVGFGRKNQCVEAHGYLECHAKYYGSPVLHMAGDRILSDYHGLQEEGSWAGLLDQVLGRSVPQDDLWEAILNLNPRAERKGEVLGVTDAAALTSEGKIYLNDWSRKGFTHHWVLDEEDNHDFKDLFEWKSVPELDEGDSPSGFTFGVKKNGMPVLVEYRSEDEPENVNFADIAEGIMSLCRIKKVEEDTAHLFILHTGGEVSAFCFSQEMLDELIKWKDIVDIRILTGCVAGLTEDGRTLISPKRMGECYYDGYQKLKDIPFKHLRKLHTEFYSPIPDWVDFRTARQLDFFTEGGGSYRALMDDGTILVALFAPGFATRITPSFPVERLIFFEEEEFVALSEDQRAAIVAWDYDRKEDRHFLRFIEFPESESPAKVIVERSGYMTYVYFLTPNGRLYEWDDREMGFQPVRDDLLDCGSNGIAYDDPYFGTLARDGHLEIKTTHRTLFAPCKLDNVKRAVFARHHVVYLKDDGTVGFMGKPRACCKGLDQYRDVADIEGTDSTTTLRLADGSSVFISSKKTVRTPPDAG